MNKEFWENAKSAKSAEELITIGRATGTELSAAQANEIFGKLHTSGELSDDELDAVAGGGCGGSGGDNNAQRVTIVRHNQMPDGSNHVGHSGYLQMAHSRYSVACDCGKTVPVNGYEDVKII